MVGSHRLFQLLSRALKIYFSPRSIARCAIDRALCACALDLSISRIFVRFVVVYSSFRRASVGSDVSLCASRSLSKLAAYARLDRCFPPDTIAVRRPAESVTCRSIIRTRTNRPTCRRRFSRSSLTINRCNSFR